MFLDKQQVPHQGPQHPAPDTPPAPAVVNCSLFNPTPSLSAMIINHFKMRSDIDSFNLGGRGTTVMQGSECRHLRVWSVFCRNRWGCAGSGPPPHSTLSC